MKTPPVATDVCHHKFIDSNQCLGCGKTTAQLILSEARKAYWDCWGNHSFRESIDRRMLNWRATVPVNTVEAVDIMKQVTPSGYEDFHAELLRNLPKNAQITLAREQHVCIYIKGRLPATNTNPLGASEVSFDGTHTRLWWD